MQAIKVNTVPKRYRNLDSSQSLRIVYNLGKNKAVLMVIQQISYIGIKNVIKSKTFNLKVQKFDIDLTACKYTTKQTESQKAVHHNSYIQNDDAMSVYTYLNTVKVYDAIDLAKRLNHNLVFWGVDKSHYFRAKEIERKGKNEVIIHNKCIDKY